ncbi:MAG: ABC transporter substrate-binding protein [Planctomycetota bacterium]
MRDALPKIVIVGLLVLIVGVPIVLKPAGGADASRVEADEQHRLVVFTPHNEQIRHEIAIAYNKHRLSSGLAPVQFDWRSPGGTGDIRKSILSQYEAIVSRGDSLDDGIGADLFFGGGDYDHGKVASGVEVERDGQEIDLRIVDDPEIPAELMASVFPAERIGGERLYRRYTFVEEGQDKTYLGWTGVTLSSFGIVYNRDVLRLLKIGNWVGGFDPTLPADEQESALPEFIVVAPTTWADLTDARYLGWVALADPSHSGSITATFNAVLRREGWDEGWHTLRRVFANARYFATSSDKIPVDVSKGDAAVGMCIDFYGRYQSGMIGGDRLGYVDPIIDGKSMTATTADPVTLLRGAPHKELAQHFIHWLLSIEAQGVWQRRLDSTAAGMDPPDKYELRRQPIRQDIYTDEQRVTWTDPEINPYPTAFPFPDGTPDYYGIIAVTTQAMAIDTHDDLIAAWKAVIEAKKSGHPNLSKMLDLFDAMPEPLTLTWPSQEIAQNWEAIQADPSHPDHAQVVETLNAWGDKLDKMSKDSEQMEINRIRWRSFFQDNYRAIVRLGKE